MITKQFGEISHETAGTKYGHEPMVEFLFALAGDSSYLDDQTGGEGFGWFGLMGRWILQSDDYGFCYAKKYASTIESDEAFQAIDNEYSVWRCDATCNVCETSFDSEEGSCWACGARSYRDKDDAFDESMLTAGQLVERARIQQEGL